MKIEDFKHETPNSMFIITKHETQNSMFIITKHETQNSMFTITWYYMIFLLGCLELKGDAR